MSTNKMFYHPESKILMLSICSLNKKTGGIIEYNESQGLASKLVKTRGYLLEARREAFDLLFSGQIKWQGIPLGDLDYNKELKLGKDFGGDVEDAKYLPAIYRYDGRFYGALGREGKNKLLRSRHHTLFMSGLYGLVMPPEPIQLYSMPIERASKVQKIWTKSSVITQILAEYVGKSGVNRIFDITSRTDYRELIDWNIVARSTGAQVLHCFSRMAAGDYALISFAKFMRNFALEASEEELLAIKPETVIEGVVIRDVPYTWETLPAEEWKRIQEAEKQIPSSPAYSVQEIPSRLRIGQLSDIGESGDWLISFTPEFLKSLSRVGDKKMEGRILNGIAWLSQNPTRVLGDTNKPLVGPLKGKWRYRIGDYRLLHQPEVEKRIVFLLLISPRGDVYDH